jgi:hypothetical protein
VAFGLPPSLLEPLVNWYQKIIYAVVLATCHAYFEAKRMAQTAETETQTEEDKTDEENLRDNLAGLDIDGPDGMRPDSHRDSGPDESTPPLA